MLPASFKGPGITPILCGIHISNRIGRTETLVAFISVSPSPSAVKSPTFSWHVVTQIKEYVSQPPLHLRVVV